MNAESSPEFAQPLSGADLHAYNNLLKGAVAFNRNDLRYMEFSGAKAADTLSGLVTSKVLSLNVGQGQYSVALTPRGRILADLHINRIAEDRYLVSTVEAAWEGWVSMIRKYVNPRLTSYKERSFQTLSIHGPTSQSVTCNLVASVTSIVPELERDAADYSSVLLSHNGSELLIISSPELGKIKGYEILAEDSLAQQISEQAARDHAMFAGTRMAWEVARVEAGRPLWGRDMDDNNFPQEANLGELGALSFDKGCYTGQEVVARIHFRGHVNRNLRVISTSSPACTGALVKSADQQLVGEIKTAVVSPKLGAIAFALLKRGVENGAKVDIYWSQDSTLPDDSGHVRN